MMRRAAIVLLASGCVACAAGAGAPPASASALCGVVGIFSGLAGKACNVASGPLGGVVKKVLGSGSTASKLVRGAGLAAVAVWVLEGAKSAIAKVGAVLSESTSPQLSSTWFSSRYWRMTAIAALLTLPFLFAAAVQALIRGDMTLLARAAFGYLPLATLATAIAAPLTMLLLAASDEMSAIVSSAAGSGGSVVARGAMAGILSQFKGGSYLVFVVGLLATAGALALWLELVIREAAVYVIVLMLPLAFAAMVWPARRVWAIRSVELLVALILSKFAIVAVLTLGAGAVHQIDHLGVASALAGVALLILATCAPWALLRLLPMSELAGGAGGSLSSEMRGIARTGAGSSPAAASLVAGEDGGDRAHGVTAQMRRDADDAEQSQRGGDAPAPDVGDAVPPPAAVAGAVPTIGLNGAAGAPAGALGGPPSEGAPPATNGTPAAGGGAPPGSNGTGGASTEQLPGLPPIWQAGDFEHRPVTLGIDDYSPTPPPVWPAEPDGGEPPRGEDHDPLPERQPPGDDAR